MDTQPRSVGPRPSPWRRLHFIAPLVFVNLLALIGQSIWTDHKLKEVFLSQHARTALLFAVLMGLTLESIGTYLSLQAHAALMADQSSGGLRLFAYAIGAVMAALNFTHFSAAPINSTALGVMFALASLCSPWLWAVESKAANLARLAERGIVDPRGVKLSTSRKIWHPKRSLAVVRYAAWAGETDPARAVEGWTQSTLQSAEPTTPVQATIVQSTEPVPPVRESVEPVRQLAIESTDSVSDVAPAQSTEMVTRTVTRTESVTETHSVRVQSAIATLTDRVRLVREHPDFAIYAELSYDQIGSIIGRTGRGVIKPVFAVLYLGQSVESVIVRNG